MTDSELTKDRQITQLKAELDKALADLQATNISITDAIERLEAWRAAYREAFIALPNFMCQGSEIKRLRDLGEI